MLAGAGLLGAGALGLRCGLPVLWRARPIVPLDELSDDVRALVAAAFEGVDASARVDVHAHCVGLETERNGTWVNPASRSHANPLERFRFEVYLAAAGVRPGPDDEGADEAYLSRLLALHRAANPAGKLLLLAFDQHVAEDGTPVPDRTPFHTPDAYVLALARAHHDVLACASVHPYRADALERLEAAAAGGAVAVKWLPNAMGIDPAAPRCEAFYRRLTELGLVLLTHTGLEQAVHAPDAQELGNPLRLRRPLDAGVRVVAAHCASLGTDLDLDHPQRGRVPSFELFLRLMGEERSRDRLFGDLSAVTQVNRDARVLRELLRAPELHARLVDGSDYPLPAIDPLISPRLLVWHELLPADERAPLDALFRANPLLFDFVLKRRLRLVTAEGELRFRPQVFESARLFAG